MFLAIYINHFRFCLCFSISRTNNAINNAVHNTGRGYNNNNVASVSGSNHNNGNHFPNAISSVGTVIVRAGSTASIGGSSSSGSSRISSGGGSNTVSNNNVIMANGPIASGTRSQYPIAGQPAMSNGSSRMVDDASTRYDMPKVSANIATSCLFCVFFLMCPVGTS